LDYNDKLPCGKWESTQNRHYVDEFKCFEQPYGQLDQHHEFRLTANYPAIDERQIDHAASKKLH